MLTVDFARLPPVAGIRALDLGCGAGRHAFELYRRGADVDALDRDGGELERVEAMFAAMREAGEAPPDARAAAVQGDALGLPYPDASFDLVVAAEVLEHVEADAAAIAEIVRVTRPGGHVVVTVPRWLPERICWTLSRAYHGNPGGHVRIYTGGALAGKLMAAGLTPPYAHHHAHALHSPYWWLRCAVGVDNTDHPLPALYHRMLVWDIMRRPRVTRVAEAALNPVIGKSLVLYLRRPWECRAVA